MRRDTPPEMEVGDGGGMRLLSSLFVLGAITLFGLWVAVEFLRWVTR